MAKSKIAFSIKKNPIQQFDQTTATHQNAALGWQGDSAAGKVLDAQARWPEVIPKTHGARKKKKPSRVLSSASAPELWCMCTCTHTNSQTKLRKH